MYDVVVVGAGPCGSTAARHCAGYGLTTLLIEEHATIGHPVQCAGLLSTNAFNECNVTDASIIQHVQGARIVSGSGSDLSFDAGEIKAYVVDRAELDREIAEQAVHAGVEIRLKTHVHGITDNEILTSGVNGKERIPFRILIAADGPRSSIARMYGMKRSPVYLSGIQADIPYEMDPRYVEVHPNASPDFFGWIIPAGNGRARIGMCGTKDMKSRFSSFVDNYGTTCLHQVTGTIPLGVMPKTYGNKTLFVGDAAGFAKPTSGGGIYTGVRSAKYAADMAAYCCNKGKFDDRALSEYENKWKADFGRELAFSFHMLRIRQQLTPAQINEFCRILSDPAMTETIVKYGDMDRPGKVISRLAMKPALFRMVGKMFLSELGIYVKRV